MAAKFVDVGIFRYPPKVDELGERLFRDAIDIHTFLADEACKLAQLLGRTVGIGAVERLGATDFADGNLGRCMTDRTVVRNGERASASSDGNDFGDNLVGLDNAELGARTANAQTLALTDVTQGGTTYGGTLQLYGLDLRVAVVWQKNCHINLENTE